MPRLLRPGDIVTDIDRESMFQDEQGEVVKVQLRLWGRPPEVLVRFDGELDLWDFNDTKPEWVYDIYPPKDLRLDPSWKDPDRFIVKELKRIYGRHAHSYSLKPQPLNPDKLCDVEGCEHKQTKAGWFNCYGSVSQIYVCSTHATHYRKWSCGDIFPWRSRHREIRSA